MKRFFLLVVLMIQQSASAQFTHQTIPSNNPNVAFNTALAPFYWGVASGDPSANSVVIWTKVESTAWQEVLEYAIATDENMNNVIQRGEVITDGSRNYCAKTTITGLNPDTYYYYNFKTQNGIYSLTGRMKTAPVGSNSNVKFGVVSCSNYQAGHFNAYKSLSRKNDLDAILHLGDYIYEYEEGGYGYNAQIGRGHEPDNEIITLADYRTRYSFYRLDPDLIRCHQQHTFITIWDDHESANDAYVDGAENHQPATEGDWQQRKAIAKQVYFEWMPVTDNATNKIYKKISYGNLVDLFMIDTRLEGRTEQPDSMSQADYMSPSRTILGATQRDWLESELLNSTAQWKLIGNQVIFSRVNVNTLRIVDSRAEGLFLDTWQGYPYERAYVENLIKNNNINNVVFLTGDIHAAIGFDITSNPNDVAVYNPATGQGAFAVEFVGASVTSPNFDELVASSLVSVLQQILVFDNPHAKYNNLVDHGYYILDVNSTRTQADYFMMDTIKVSNENASIDASWFTANNGNHLQESTTPASPKPFQATQAPDSPLTPTSIFTPATIDKLLLASLQPNLVQANTLLSFVLNKPEKLRIEIIDMQGKIMQRISEQTYANGLHSILLDVHDLPSAKYFIVINTGMGIKQIPFSKQ